MWYFLLWLWGFGTGLLVGLIAMWVYCFREAAGGFMIQCPACKVRFNSNDGVEDL